jgi:putative Mg2+ transporter-C (MgtC) family protein
MDAVHLDHWEIICRLAVGTGLGAAIGLQREFDGHDAGLRTHALLTLGSTLFGIVSVAAFDGFIGPESDSNVTIDVSRIASYLVAGVGFLAGGSILRHSNRVQGLTTAASLWVSSAIGLGAGLGFYLGAIAATVATLFLLVIERPVELVMRRLRRRRKKEEPKVSIRAVITSGVPLVELLALTKSKGIRRTALGGGRTEIVVSGVALSVRDEVLAALEERDDLVELSCDVE